MAEQRTVIIHMDAVQQLTMQFETGHHEWYKAIGRLSAWNMTFPTVNIYKDGDTDMIAVYLNEQGERGYAISAVWRGDHYDFHS